MTRSQRKALRFAFKLMRGDYRNEMLPYVSGFWIYPDRDPERPYLDEATFTDLMMLGYVECRAFLGKEMQWMYRISREGCVAMGWDYPLRLIIGKEMLRRRLNSKPNGHLRRFPLPPREKRPKFDNQNFHTRRQAYFRRGG
ncbi:MAG: hypothetical protein U0694_13300 [Anaerolineae bacterium]